VVDTLVRLLGIIGMLLFCSIFQETLIACINMKDIDFDYYHHHRDIHYPVILIPESVKQTLASKPKIKEPNQFGGGTLLAVGLGVATLATPIGWLGLAGAAAAFMYDQTIGLEERTLETEKENKKAMEILKNPSVLRKYMLDNLKRNSFSKQFTLQETNARVGRYDNVLLEALEKVRNWDVVSGKGLNLGYTFTPDIILRVPSVDLWIDIEVDEPWFWDGGYKKAIHYIGKDSYRNQQFLTSGWIVVRFAEEQVVNQLQSCVKQVFQILHTLNLVSYTRFNNIPNITPTPRWDQKQAITISRDF
jgi:hypothetical protein